MQLLSLYLVAAKEGFWIAAKLRFVFCSGECKPSANFAILPLLIHCILHFMSAAVVQCWVWVWVEILQPTGCTTRWTLSVYCSKLRIALQAGGCITHTADALALASLSVSVEIRAENAPYQRRMPLKNRTQGRSRIRIWTEKKRLTAMKWSSCGWSFYQLEQWCPPLTVKPFRAQSFTLLRPNLFPVSQSKNDQRSASDGLRSNFKCFSLSCPGPISVLEALRQKWCFFPLSFYQSCLLARAGGRYGWMNIHSLRAERGVAATCCQQRQLWFPTTLSPAQKTLSPACQ